MRESAIRDLCDNIRMQDGLVFGDVMGWKRHLPLTTAQFRQALLPNAPELDFDLQPLHEILALGRLQLCEVTR
jgi:hypothetical protein